MAPDNNFWNFLAIKLKTLVMKSLSGLMESWSRSQSLRFVAKTIRIFWVAGEEDMESKTLHMVTGLCSGFQMATVQ